jgi:hypothetical protein
VTILRIGRTLTGQTTRPAPRPGLGLETDKFTPAAIDAHLAAFTDRLLTAAGKARRPGRGLTTLHFDSWEMSAQNGSENLLREFRARRGYDPLRYLPALTGRVVGSVEVTERFLWDVRQTAQELVIENHAGRIRDYAHRNGLQFSTEPYDMNPCCDLELGAAADVPMCEFWSKGYGFDTEYSCFEAVSVAHTMGRPVVGAEAFTAAPGEDWRQHPASMKAQADWALGCGINRITFHTFQHQPRLDQRPGMTMGPYGVQWNRNQTWWEMAGAFHAYLARCQALLREGLPVADLLYLVPEGAPQVFRPPSDATEGDRLPDRRGYNFDGCAPGALLARASVKQGRIAFPDGMSYRALVLPNAGAMTPTLMAKVAQLAEDGATVIGSLPTRSPSLTGYPACDAEVARLAERARAKVVAAGPTAEQSEAFANPLGEAKWIWCADAMPAMQAPVGARRFSRSVALDGAAAIEAARIWATADNGFALSVNGKAVGEGNNFHQVKTFDVSALLRPGANEIALSVENGGDAPNPAGLIAGLAVKFADGRVLRVATDRAWQSEGKAAVELGAFDLAPWNLKPPTPPPPELYPSYAAAAHVLQGLGVPPDFESDGRVRYGHRAVNEADVYFIANCEEAERDAVCRFRVSGKSPEWWNPLTGERRALPEWKEKDGRTEIPLRLEPLGSGFVVFREKGSEVGEVHGSEVQGPGVEGRTSRVTGRNIRDLRTAFVLKGPWDVTFDPAWGGPEKAVTFEDLSDWTDQSDPRIRYYSGTAVYRKAFDCTGLRPPNADIFLSLGSVKNLASVALNGRDLGTVWCAPWRVRIPDGLLRERGNELTVRVANLWVNRLIGDAGLPPERRLTQTTRNPYKPDAPLQPSGLLGPVTIREGPWGEDAGR